jgi:hypothetical protein
MSDPKTYSILLRLRRITIEDGYVAVPLTPSIMAVGEDGKNRIDTDAFTREGLRLGSDSRVEWRVEERNVECHPFQQARPEDRAVLDPFLDDEAPIV